MVAPWTILKQQERHVAKNDAAALAALCDDEEPVPADKLRQVRDLTKRARDIKMEVADLDERSKASKRELWGIEHDSLPELMAELGLKGIELEAEGNLPAYSAKLKPYYHANIKVDWPDEKREEAFTWIENKGGGDMIQTVIAVELPRTERNTAIKVERALDKLKVPYTSEKAIHHGTLSAWIKEMVEVHKEVPPLDLLGATIGSIVVIKPIKEKK